MNIHEYQAKELLKEFGAPVSKGVVILSLNEIDEKIKELNSKEFVLKAQIHAGGRGKGGGVKLVKSIEELKTQAKKMFGMRLITHQTGPEGKKVKRLYVEEASDIENELYEKSMEIFKLLNHTTTDDFKNVAQKILTLYLRYEDWMNKDKTLQIDILCEIFYTYKKFYNDLDVNDFLQNNIKVFLFEIVVDDILKWWIVAYMN